MKWDCSKILLLLIVFLAFFLRFYKLTQIPGSLYFEEVALGYDAYSILKTGKDHHDNSFPIVAFESFGDYKPSLYFYATVPSITLFGLNEFGVRFPSAFFGGLTIIIIYLICKELFYRKKISINIGLFSALFLTILPWHILVSRVAFETNLGLFCFSLALYLFLFWQNRIEQKNIQFILFLSAIFFSLSMYAYHSYRLLTPLVGLSLAIIYFKKITKSFLAALSAVIVFFLLISPILLNLNNKEITQRFAETSAFSTLDPILKSNQAKEKMGNSLIARVIHHRYRYYGEIFIKNYVSHFNFNFLFVKGDTNLRHSTGNNGQIYYFMLPLLLLSIFFIFKNKEKKMILPLLLLILCPVPAATTKEVPHALRTLTLVIPLTILFGYAIFNFFLLLKQKPIYKAVILIFAITCIYEFFHFEIYYMTKYYPRTSVYWWNDGNKKMLSFVDRNKSNYDQIIITRDNDRPAMFYWFYNQTDPTVVQQWDNLVAKNNEEYLQFENLYFTDIPKKEGKQMLVSFKPESGNLLTTIFDINNKPVFYIYER